MSNLPYVGFRPYSTTEAPWFRGRKGEVGLLRDVYEEQMSQRGKLLVIYGPSGVGKTSFVQAGLWPEVRLCKDVTQLLRFEPEPTESLSDFTQRIRQRVGRISGSRTDRALVFIDEIDRTMGYSLNGEIDTETKQSLRLLLEFLSQAAKRGIARIVIGVREPWSRYLEDAPASWAFLQSRLEFFRLDFLCTSGLTEVLRQPLQRWLESHPFPGMDGDTLYRHYFAELAENPELLPLFSVQLRHLLKGRDWNPGTPSLLDLAVQYAESTATQWPVEDLEEKFPAFLELFQAAATHHTEFGPRSAPMMFLEADPDARVVAGHLIDARLLTLHGERWRSAEAQLTHHQLFSAWPRTAALLKPAASEKDANAGGDFSVDRPAAG